jgi:hypothetical protein
MRTTNIDHEDGGTVYMKHGATRVEMITVAAARALEDSIRALPADTVPVRRVSFTITVECRQAEGDSPARVVVVESELSVQKVRACTVIEGHA